MKTLRLIFVVIVIAACLVPSVLMFCGYKNANRENRPLAQMPKLFTDGSFNEEFTSRLDDYVEDRFALREYLVTAFNAADVALLSDFNGTNAVIGKKNHIFYAETTDDHLGINQLTPGQIDSIVNFLADIMAEVRSRGGKFAFMTAPNKASIYPEYMPSRLYVTDAPRNIDMLTAALKERGIPVIDAKAILLEAKEERTVYYEHDSHWNNFGAMLVYNSIAEEFGLRRYDPRDYTVEYDRTGDLHNFVYPSTEYPEERIIYPLPDSYKSKRPINFDRDKEIETTSEENELTLLVYHDSFGRSLQPILSTAVGRLSMNSYFPYKLDYIEELEPDLVLIELVERNLDMLYEHAASLGY
ncbi:MAG: hypothetical protein IKG85_03665 [Clostridia bacterium]|nr:hypothetical protein [Clostridia bacterium]